MKFTVSSVAKYLSFRLGTVLVFICSIAYGDSLKLAVGSDGTILSGGPSSDQGKAAMEKRIEEQSNGKIQLLTFTALKTKRSNVELDGHLFYEMEFESDVKVLEPCLWATSYRGKPLTFLTFPATNGPASSLFDHPIEVKKSEVFTVKGAVWFQVKSNQWVDAGFAGRGIPQLVSGAQRQRCVTNLRHISVAFALWSLEHGDQFPFNVSTNKGGSLEFCSAGRYDTHSDKHLKTLSEELPNPEVLVCPSDSTKKIAASFQKLGAENVSYLVHTGRGINENNPGEILVRCPVHHLTLDVSGDVNPKP